MSRTRTRLWCSGSTTPAQWQPGGDVIIAGSVSDDQAKERYPNGWRQPLPYMRIVAAPVG